MKKLLCILMFALFSVSAFAGVAKFSAKHVVKPAAQKSYKAVKYSAKKASRAVKATGKAAAKVAY